MIFTQGFLWREESIARAFILKRKTMVLVVHLHGLTWSFAPLCPLLSLRVQSSIMLCWNNLESYQTQFICPQNEKHKGTILGIVTEFKAFIFKADFPQNHCHFSQEAPHNMLFQLYKNI